MKTIFFDVDTQNDFMNSDGALYVPDAESLKPSLKQLTQFAMDNGIPILGSVDCHSEEDAEFIANGGPFPFHCMKGSEGQRKIPETLTGKETFISSTIGLLPSEWGWLSGGMGTGDHLMFEKQTNDVMTNRTLQVKVKGLEDASDITTIVYGVATDYCVKAAALGLRSFGMQVCVVRDAIKAITPEGREEAFAEFEKAGIQLVTLYEVLQTVPA